MWGKRALRQVLVGGIATALASSIAVGAEATPALYSTTAIIPVGQMPTGVEACHDEIYVANFNGSSLSVIDPNTYAVTDTINVQTNPYMLACDGTSLYVTNYGSDTVSVVNTMTHQVVANVPVDDGPTDVAIANGYAYVSNQSVGTVSLINTTTRNVDHTLSVGVGGYPLGIAVAAGKVFVGNQQRSRGHRHRRHNACGGPNWGERRHYFILDR